MCFSAVLVYPCTSVGNWLLIPQLSKEGNSKMYRCEMAKGGLQPQKRAPQKRSV